MRKENETKRMQRQELLETSVLVIHNVALSLTLAELYDT